MKATDRRKNNPGRPRVPSPRVPILARVDLVTLARIKADIRDGENVGRVLDRWAAERKAKYPGN